PDSTKISSSAGFPSSTTCCAGDTERFARCRSSQRSSRWLSPRNTTARCQPVRRRDQPNRSENQPTPPPPPPPLPSLRLRAFAFASGSPNPGSLALCGAACRGHFLHTRLRGLADVSAPPQPIQVLLVLGVNILLDLIER